MRFATARAPFSSALLVVALCAPLAGQEVAAGSAARGGVGTTPVIVRHPEPAAEAPTFGTTGMSVLALSSSAFVPNDSTTVWTYSLQPQGGQYIVSGHRFLDHTVLLPSGALVKKIELDGCDNTNGGSILLYFSKCPVGGPCTDISSVGTDTTDVPGCGRFPLTLPSPVTIDNFNASYYVDVYTSGSDLATFFAVRLYYQLQISPAPATATFGDVPTTNLYFRAIEALAASGITGGCGNGNFCPDQNVTRGELAKFLANALGLYWAP
ncbi:MAG TPA: S-layer homology domain-containing protein [Thermoanaerobaculia bacterium]|nr:S-layer homology domain-containing protein [Thermoanaerobaculia bacterium]